MTKIFVSIGSNYDREKNIKFAINKLKSKFGDLICSKIYKSKNSEQKNKFYYNLVIIFSCNENLETLKKILKNIELETGRNKNLNPSLITLDIDILMFGDYNFSPDVDIPRNEILKHDFVLKSLCEISPKTKHPIFNKTFEELWQNFKGEKLIEKEIKI